MNNARTVWSCCGSGGLGAWPGCHSDRATIEGGGGFQRSGRAVETGPRDNTGWIEAAAGSACAGAGGAGAAGPGRRCGLLAAVKVTAAPAAAPCATRCNNWRRSISMPRD
ncbi:hypothetical protein GCM10010430_51380 [Kitasatospora cystarginea]|uniref:Uncharacterized protein n=1 Tax=Kitasatospora cystarginea TaxID=58350 RepID=A0ABN3EJC6_9ACTN